MPCGRKQKTSRSIKQTIGHSVIPLMQFCRHFLGFFHHSPLWHLGGGSRAGGSGLGALQSLAGPPGPILGHKKLNCAESSPGVAV